MWWTSTRIPADHDVCAGAPMSPSSPVPLALPDEAESPREFEPYMDESTGVIFRRGEIVAGLGQPEQWASHWPPEQFKAEAARGLDFAYTNKTHFLPMSPCTWI